MKMVLLGVLSFIVLILALVISFQLGYNYGKVKEIKKVIDIRGNAEDLIRDFKALHK